jgi:hypothetical protein
MGHLTEVQRYEISTLKRAGKTRKEICVYLFENSQTNLIPK